jgi:hypothetical protein
VDQWQQAAVLTRLVDKLREQGSWAGETHLQKAVFFLEELLGCPLGFDFILYMHGPFSFDLRDELTSLRAGLILTLEPQAPPYGPKFASTSIGQKVVKRYSGIVEEQGPRIDFVAGLFRNRGVKELERLATALYTTRELGWDSSVEPRAKLLNEVKPHVSLEEAREAVATLDGIRDEVRHLGLDRPNEPSVLA